MDKQAILDEIEKAYTEAENKRLSVSFGTVEDIINKHITDDPPVPDNNMTCPVCKGAGHILDHRNFAGWIHLGASENASSTGGE